MTNFKVWDNRRLWIELSYVDWWSRFCRWFYVKWLPVNEWLTRFYAYITYELISHYFLRLSLEDYAKHFKLMTFRYFCYGSGTTALFFHLYMNWWEKQA